MTTCPINFMEVCGTHTMSIARYGLRKLFPAGVKMLSGPGCPVCVTPIAEIDRALAVGREKKVVIATFGDMLHVPGSSSSLERERAQGMDVRVVYSPMDALDMAAAEPGKEIVALGVGFETTTPAFAAAVMAARRRKTKNFSVLPMFKTVPNALRAILEMKKRKIHGFVLPGHVSTIIGSHPYEFIAGEYGVPGVIAGFEPEDITRAVNMLLKQITKGEPRIEIQYTRAVKAGGNPYAQKAIDFVFEPVDANWRAVGIIPQSGLGFRKEYSAFDAARKFPVKIPPAAEPRGCACGQILLGLKSPADCVLFGKRCLPAHPIGPCMVSSEGACAAEYKYGGDRKKGIREK